MNCETKNLDDAKKKELIQFYLKKRQNILNRKISSDIDRKIANEEYLDVLYNLENLGIDI